MYLCYCDESGYCGNICNPEQPVMVMAGILPNVYNYHRSDAEFRQVFDIINDEVPVNELKGQQIYRGRGAWRNIHSESRDEVIEFYLNWINERSHKLIISAVDNAKYFQFLEENPHHLYSETLQSPYLFCGLHVAMTVQKLNRNQDRNKGKTILIYDEQDEFSNRLTELLFDPPEFIDEFVACDLKKEETRLSQIIDSAFFVKSHHSSMAQVVDIVAYLVRLYLELNYYDADEAYIGEKAKINDWVDRIRDKFVQLSTMYPKTRREFLDFINTIKAKGIRE
jgi:hypothetical protein